MSVIYREVRIPVFSVAKLGVCYREVHCVYQFFCYRGVCMLYREVHCSFVTKVSVIERFTAYHFLYQKGVRYEGFIVFIRLCT